MTKTQAALEGLERAEKNGDLTTWLKCFLPVIRSALKAQECEEVTDKEIMACVSTAFKTGAGLTNILAAAYPNGLKIINQPPEVG